jgi:hypothetical protein
MKNKGKKIEREKGEKGRRNHSSHKDPINR